MNDGIFVQNLLDKPFSDNGLPRTLSGSNTVSLPYNYAGDDDWRIDKNSIVLIFDLRYEDNTSITLRIGGSYNNIIVDWGDGKKNNYSGSFGITYQYANRGIYVVQINGIINSLGAPGITDRNTLIKCLSFGNTVTSLRWAFGGSSALGNINLTTVPDQIPTTCTSLNSCFIGCSKFNDPKVRNWNTSNILDMSSIFNGCGNFNQPLDSWDTSNVTNLSSAFQFTPFNQPIGNWNVSKVTNFVGMFNFSRFNQDISNWDTSSATSMNSMFAQTPFNYPIGNWDVSKVTDFGGLFFISSSNGPFNQDLSSWNINSNSEASVIMSNMFLGCAVFNNGSNSGINNWNTSRVTATNGMFSACFSFNQPLDSWNTSNVTNMTTMFQVASSFNQNLDNWDVSKVTNFSSMFNGATSFNGSLSGWQLTANNTNCTNMFQSATSFQGIGLDSWNTSGVTNMNGMFNGATRLGSGINLDLSNWNVNNVSSTRNMFRSCTNLKNITISGWNFKNGCSLYDMFNGANISGAYLPNWTFNGNNDAQGLFAINNMTNVSGLDTWNTSGITTTRTMFYVNGTFEGNGVQNWNTSNIIDMSFMFYGNSKFNANLSSWDTSKVTTMFYTFIFCNSFKGSGLENWNLAGLNRSDALHQFALNSNFPSNQYDLILNAWNTNKASGVNGIRDWRTDLAPSFGSSKYTVAASGARASLVSYGWTITDGGIA